MMNFDEWREQAKIREPYLSRGISLLDIWEAARNEGLEQAAKVCDEADRSIHPAELADRIRMLKD